MRSGRWNVYSGSGGPKTIRRSKMTDVDSLMLEKKELQQRIKRIGKMMQLTKDLSLILKYRLEVDRNNERIREINEVVDGIVRNRQLEENQYKPKEE
jgi:hypothetical protein